MVRIENTRMANQLDNTIQTDDNENGQQETPFITAGRGKFYRAAVARRSISKGVTAMKNLILGDDKFEEKQSQYHSPTHQERSQSYDPSIHGLHTVQLHSVKENRESVNNPRKVLRPQKDDKSSDSDDEFIERQRLKKPIKKSQSGFYQVAASPTRNRKGHQRSSRFRPESHQFSDNEESIAPEEPAVVVEVNKLAKALATAGLGKSENIPNFTGLGENVQAWLDHMVARANN